MKKQKFAFWMAAVVGLAGWIMASGAFVVPGVPRNVTLEWDYDTNDVVDAFNIRWSANLAVPVSQGASEIL